MAKETPLVKQYREIKSQYPDTLLFFRLGDFYELFGDDAIEGSKLMEIALTKRADMPLCGIPYHSATRYIKKIIDKSKSIAICEQVEDPATAKGIVKREVVRVITPGTILEDELLSGDMNNFLASIAKNEKYFSAVFLDISTGEFMGCQLDSLAKLEGELSRLPVKEVVISDKQMDLETLLKKRFQDITISYKDAWYFNETKAVATIKDFFAVSTLKGLEIEDKPALVSACGGLLAYLEDTQKVQKPKLRKFRLYSVDENMVLDRNTQENLELVKNLQNGKKKNTLFEVLDHTSTAMGRRKLLQWILRPLKELPELRQRLNSVEEFIDKVDISDSLVTCLKEISDMERILQKASYGSCNSRDLVNLRESIKIIPKIKDFTSQMNSELIVSRGNNLDELKGLLEELETALVDEPPLTIKEGRIIKKSYSKELDKFIEITSGDKQWVADLEESERQRLNIPKLKVGYNRVHGYYIEITKVHSDKVPPEYQRKQTLVNSERYTTEELKTRESSILGAEDKRNALEYELFCSIREKVVEKSVAIQKNSHMLAQLDVLNSFSIASKRYNYTKPQVGDWGELYIKDGRHPMVENNIGINQFISNDTLLDSPKHQIAIITGPNMAGKSTYLKQVAIITIMAQIGCFVPAAESRIGLVDRIFTRIGANENLSAGESTFMVEMTEVASILNNASKDSLLIMDEVGRGTSTFDGISIAWSVIEEIAGLKARTLFATHYFELTELSSYMEEVENFNFDVREWQDKKEVVFLRKLVPGSADKSYGIHCAQLAGVPKKVIDRSWEIFKTLEQEQLDESGLPKAAHHEDDKGQLNFFGISANSDEYKNKLQDLDLNTLSPLELQAIVKNWQDEISRDKA